VEIIVSDDGSTDNTVAQVNRIAQEHSCTFLKVVATERVGGVVPNFERAVRACQGDVIALCDHDDVWTSTRLATAVAALPSSGPALVFANARLIDGSGVPLGSTLFDTIRFSHRERALLAQGQGFHVLLRRNVVTGATALLTRDLLESALPFPRSWVHDEWLAAIASALGQLVLVDECLIDYRVHGANQIGVVSPTTTARARRMMSPRGDRYPRLWRKYADLLERLEALDVPDHVLFHLRRKVAFESSRATYPGRRWKRPLPVLRRWNLYRSLSSQGLLDIVRDIAQPA
jgi:glycosyltransferase involved in cell wall biosynthesis